MRIRSVWAFPTVLISALALAVPLSTATAAAPAPDPTVTFTVVDADGRPAASGKIKIVNTDSLLGDYPGTATVKAGKAKVKLPKGHYSALGVAGSGPAANRVTRIVPITDFTVGTKPVALTIDYRRADQRPTVSVPQSAVRRSLSVNWLRFDTESGLPGGTSVDVGAAGDVLVAPEAPAKVGRVSVTYAWQLAGPGASPGWTYDLAVNTDGFHSGPAFTFTPADLATVTSSYYGDGGAEKTGSFLRYAAFAEDAGFGSVGKYQPVTRGTRRIEYVGSRGSTPLWSETARADTSSTTTDPGRTDTLNPRPIPAGAQQKKDWFRGPIAPGVPTFRYRDGGLCLNCQGKTAMEVLFTPLTDSVSDHVGLMRKPATGAPIGRFRAYRDGHKVKDSGLHTLAGYSTGLSGNAELPVLGGRIPTPAKSARYTAVVDVNRRAQHAGVSTVSRTTVGFSTRPGQGALPPSDWGCITSHFNCRVLPMLTAHLSMPLSLDGTLPADRSTFTLTAARIQHARPAKITTATLSVRATGQTTWRPLPLHRTADGTYTATVDNTAWTGSAVDVRFSARDADGSTFEQTVQRAYIVRGA